MHGNEVMDVLKASADVGRPLHLLRTNFSDLSFKSKNDHQSTTVSLLQGRDVIERRAFGFDEGECEMMMRVGI